MRIFARLPVAALVAVLSLAVLTGAASALRSLEVNPSGRLTRFIREMRITGGGFEISVDVTFKGTWNRVIAKRREAVVGRITEARTANCRVTRPAGATCEVEIRVEPRMPISKLYAGFTGTLPNIGGIKTDQSMPVDVTISNPSPVSCLYAGEVGVGEFGNPIEGEMITESGLSFVSGEMTCSTSPLFLAGAAAAEPRQTITLL